MFTEKIFIRLSLICLFVLFVSPSFLYADGESFWLFTNHYLASNGGVSFGFYPSGYSDGWYWGVSDSHLHWPSDYHETLSGDWAAAIYFSGIQNNKGMWLTQHFNWPNWDPVTDFNSGSYNEWNDPCNPIDNIDTARSMVETNQIRVTIDYNLVDLGEEGYSPLSFIDANGNSAYVQSERYVLIQTYTIKNVRTDHNTIQDLRFFQFLHSHPTGTYYPAQFSSYSTANYPDALKGYDPQHPDLNFRYDISQWRSGDPETEHVDWIGFSSTIEPDHFDNGFYNEANGVDQYGEPVTGTHIRIENKSLNDEPNISAYDAAGAMEWDLGNLEWNTEKKVTVAVMFGSIPSNMPLRVHNINKKRDYYTISGAIEDANNNDVLVADPSVYYETANFGSKVLTLKSSNPADPCIVASTIISGDGYNGIVTFTDNNSTINGFTITSGDYGVSCSGSSCGPTIANCLIRNNTYAGVDCWTSAVPTITNCIIRDNYTGIECYYDGQAKILNNLIVNNNYGIVVEYTDNQLTIRNNTISRNDHGIYRSDETAEPDISNCIIWNNGTSPNYNNLEGTFDNVNYCCINETRSGTGNITADPCFVAPDANDFHLKNISPCIDKGDPNFNSSTEKDIDGEDRIMDGDNNGTFRVDIGADEFCPYDLSQDGFVDFSDFAVFARSWKTSDGNTNYNYLCDYFPDSKIDYKDLYIFCNHWLWPFDGNNISGEEMMMSMEPEQEFSSAPSETEGLESMAMEEPQEDDWSSMLAGEGETASIYLICDVNEPNSGDEVTVQIYSDVPLFCMGVAISVAGDANITGAMSTADCNEYGWDPDWPSDPFFEEDGWLYINGIKWESDANGVVGYIKFRYNSGRVSVSITEDCAAYDANCEPVLISGEALTFGADPNES